MKFQKPSEERVSSVKRDPHGRVPGFRSMGIPWGLDQSSSVCVIRPAPQWGGLKKEKGRKRRKEKQQLWATFSRTCAPRGTENDWVAGE